MKFNFVEKGGINREKGSAEYTYLRGKMNLVKFQLCGKKGGGGGVNRERGVLTSRVGEVAH